MKLRVLDSILCTLREEQVLGQEEVLLHSLKQPEKELSKTINITVVNADNGSKSSGGYPYYSDAILRWWLRNTVIDLPGNYC